MKTILQITTLLALTIATCLSTHARPIAHWPYDKLTTEADFIVIATPTNVEDTGTKTILPGGIRKTGNDNIPRPIPAIKMRANFEVLSVLKGKEDTKEFIFHYLRRESEPDELINGAGLVSFEPKAKKRYLLFLRRDPDGGSVQIWSSRFRGCGAP